MLVDENHFFRQATLLICGNLDFEISLQKCLIYLKSLMPADNFRLNVYDRGLGVVKTIAMATPERAEKQDVILPLDEKGKKFLDDPNRSLSMIINRPMEDPVAAPIIRKTGKFRDYSSMVIHLHISGTKLGNLILSAKGKDRYSEEHLQLFSILNEPFAIALSNFLRWNKVNQLKDFMADDLKYLHQRLHRSLPEKIVGEDFGLKEVMEMVKEVAPMDSPVLLLGETGVGKEIIANAIHSLSHRSDKPFIAVNCGAIPESLIDSELFGHEKGSFTGASALKRGCFERANGGTIFLDEVAELPPQAQVRMLRVLQNKEIMRVGGSEQIQIDIRIIAATHQNLQDMVNNGQFRADLWFRVNVFPITIPPLRERKEDIPALINQFIIQKAKELKISDPPKLAPGSMNLLRTYSWPGNVRELENVVERALILCKGRSLEFKDIFLADKDEEQVEYHTDENEPTELDLVVSRHIRKVLKKVNGKINGPGGAAEMLGINYGTLRHRMKKLGIPHGKGKYGI
jgi:transcriptional regulator with GAF, ATPase, and Fis domain